MVGYGPAPRWRFRPRPSWATQPWTIRDWAGLIVSFSYTESIVLTKSASRYESPVPRIRVWRPAWNVYGGSSLSGSSSAVESLLKIPSHSQEKCDSYPNTFIYRVHSLSLLFSTRMYRNCTHLHIYMYRRFSLLNVRRVAHSIYKSHVVCVTLVM